jgi:hypothetical protein
METECSLPHSQAPATCSYPEPQPKTQSVETQAPFPVLGCQRSVQNLGLVNLVPPPRWRTTPCQLSATAC